MNELVKDSKNLVWMDLEMTGLDPERDTILEIATVITDSNLEAMKDGPCLAVHQPDDVLARMDSWCVEHHGSSGLTRRVRESTVTMAEAEEATLRFIQQYCHEKVAPLCSSSIHQDRRFIIKYMPRVDRFLHYRLVDVSSVKELVMRWYPYDQKPPPKGKEHLAMGDVKESISELLFYRRHYFR